MCKTASPSPAASHEPLVHCWNVANLSLFSRHNFDITLTGVIFSQDLMCLSQSGWTLLKMNFNKIVRNTQFIDDKII